ncbi:MAG: c-type cytochrome, partial [Planctomycetota bacterium]
PGHPDFDDYVGYLSNKNPWEFQHKVQFGHPGSAMPSSVAGGGTILDVADLGAYSQTLPQEPIEDPPVVRGGSMYDKWWAVTGLAAPTTDNPLWALRPDTTSNSRTGADTWRCKECHGWDYKGVNGAYAGGSHRTGIAGIFGTTKTAQEAFDLLKGDHGYGIVGLSDEDLWDLAAFVTEGLIDTDSIIDTDGAFIGSVATGQVLYDSGIGTNISCAACHGQLGLTPPPGHPDFDDYVGLISNKNPWEFQHKVQFGQPGTAMPGSVVGGGTILDVADLGAYSQTLPQGLVP